MDCTFEPKRLRTGMSMDTMDPRSEGLHGDAKCQVLGNKSMFAAACPVPSGRSSDIDDASKRFVQDYGAPDNVTVDRAKAQTSRGSEFVARLRRNRITPIVSNPHRPNVNQCETVVWESRKK